MAQIKIYLLTELARYSRALFTSFKSSIYRNGMLSTFGIVWHYFRLKRSRRSFYAFHFGPFKHKIKLRRGTSDFSVFRQIAMNGEYDLALPLQPNVIIDAGANIGLASLYFHTRFPSAKIYSLEPDPGNYRAMEEQVRGISAIKIFSYALWGKKEKLSLHLSGVDAWGIRVQQAKSDKENNISGIDLSSFMRDQKIEMIDLLKIDIEGAEVEIFEGEFDYWLQRTRILIIELHENIRPGCERIFYNALQSIRHRVYHSGENVVIYNLDLL